MKIKTVIRSLQDSLDKSETEAGSDVEMFDYKCDEDTCKFSGVDGHIHKYMTLGFIFDNKEDFERGENE